VHVLKRGSIYYNVQRYRCEKRWYHYKCIDSVLCTIVHAKDTINSINVYYHTDVYEGKHVNLEELIIIAHDGTNSAEHCKRLHYVTPHGVR
jgi:hypothetical protein